MEKEIILAYSKYERKAERLKAKKREERRKAICKRHMVHGPA
jgi:hypothetical protein